MKCSVIQDTDAPALHRARKDDGYSDEEDGTREVDRPPRGKGCGPGGGTRVGAALRKGCRDVRFVRHRLPDHRGVVVFSPRSRFTFEKICALARELIGGNNEISDPIN